MDNTVVVWANNKLIIRIIIKAMYKEIGELNNN